MAVNRRAYALFGKTRRFDIRMARGDDLDLIVTLGDAETGAARDITSATASFTVKDRVGGTQQFGYAVGSGITLTTPTAGVLTVAIAPAQTTALTLRHYAYDLEITDSGDVSTVLVGDFIMEADV